MLTTRASAAGFPASKSASSLSDDTREDPFLFPPHCRFGARRRVRVLVAQHVKGAMDHQPKQLLSGGHTLTPRVVPGDFGTDVNISQHSAPLADASQAERDDVRRALVSEIASIHVGHCRTSDKRYRDHRVSYPLRLERSEERRVGKACRSR